MRPGIRLGMQQVFRVLLLALGGGLAGLTAPAQNAPGLFPEMHWRNLGPFRGGRTHAATGVPGRPHEFYMAPVNGGVWKTDDAGRTWRPLFDGQSTQSIGAIAVAPSDPDIVYVGSGEGLRRPDLSIGNGIYKSLDGGHSWRPLGLNDGQQIPALAVDPRNPDRVFAAVLGHPFGPNAERGIFRSLDGGATWTRVLFVDENTGGSDVCLDPADPQTVYASLWESRLGPWDGNNKYDGRHGGLFKSTDGGQTWRKLTQGLPADLVRIFPALAPSDPRRIYAAVGMAENGAIYRSDDAGETWTRATTDPRPAVAIGGPTGDLQTLRVDPHNPDLVYSATIVTWRSTDGAKTWTALKGAPGGDDYQNLWINPLHPEIMLLVSDQGAAVTLNAGRTWSSWYNQSTAQLYHVSADQAFPYRVYSGQQESGSVGLATRGNDGYISFRDWHPVGASEYGYAAPDPLHPNLVYGAGRTEVTRFHWDTGQVEVVTPAGLTAEPLRAVRTQPILFSPVDPHILYYAAHRLFQTTDGGQSWRTISPDLARPHAGIPPNLGPLPPKETAAADKERGVIYALAPSPLDLATLWAGTDDGLVWLTTDGGAHWHNVTPPALTPWSKVTQIEASHTDRATAYVSVSRFRTDDLAPYVYRTRNAGRTWQLITTGLPARSPVNAVREDPVRPGLLFAASETAVAVSFDDGDHWQSLQLNLPATSMRDLCIHESDLIVATHGRGFWVLDGLAPLRQHNPAAAPAVRLYRPGPAVRIRASTNTDTPLPPDEPVGENPPDGAILDYVLPAAAPGAVLLEILDAQGKVVRRYADTDPVEPTEADLAKLSIPAYWVQRPRALPATAGAHRWVWDLHYTPPDTFRHSYPMTAVYQNTPRLPRGPDALPGQYLVRLSVGKKNFVAPLTVTMDPRVGASPADLQAHFDFQQRLAAVISHSTRTIRQGRSLLEQIEERRTHAAPPLAEMLGQWQSRLQAALEPPAPGKESGLLELNGEASGAYGRLNGTDAAPTQIQLADARHLEKEFAEVRETWEKLTHAALSALNPALEAATLPGLKPKSVPNQPDEVEDADLD